jgi:hypothetical protein
MCRRIRKLKRIFIFGALFGLLLSLWAVLTPSSPLTMHDEEIHDWVLMQTPLGSSIDDVSKVMEKNGWKRDLGHQENLGFYKMGVVGAKSIHADLGIYREWHFPVLAYWDWTCLVDVDVYWGFDENGKLIDVWVQKSWDQGL